MTECDVKDCKYHKDGKCTKKDKVVGREKEDADRLPQCYSYEKEET